MTLRDYFAAAALPVAANAVGHPLRGAQYAYQIADAMIAAREGHAPSSEAALEALHTLSNDALKAAERIAKAVRA